MSDSEQKSNVQYKAHEECKAQFTPVVDLSSKEEVKGEDHGKDEKVLYEARCKLFRYEAQDNEWKERGFGIAKLLENQVNGKIRLLMRRDQTLKICANHYLTTGMGLAPNVGNERSWVYRAVDFADEELKDEHLAIMFRDKKTAEEFKTKFEECQDKISKLEKSGPKEDDKEEKKEEKEKKDEKEDEAKSEN